MVSGGKSRMVAILLGMLLSWNVAVRDARVSKKEITLATASTVAGTIQQIVKVCCVRKQEISGSRCNRLLEVPSVP